MFKENTLVVINIILFMYSAPTCCKTIAKTFRKSTPMHFQCSIVLPPHTYRCYTINGNPLYVDLCFMLRRRLRRAVFRKDVGLDIK